MNNNDIELICLTSTSNSFELLAIEGILKENDIPYILHDNESGAYMRILTGATIYGTDIMINKDDYDKAKGLVDEIG